MGTRKKPQVIWDIEAKHALDNIYDYIYLDSPSAAKYVKRTIVKLASTLNYFSEKHARELILEEEKENYRSITKWHYKIIYEVTPEAIIIVYVFHTSQDPEKLKQFKWHD